MKQKRHKDEYPAGRTGLAECSFHENSFMNSLTSKVPMCLSTNASIPLKIMENFLRLKRADMKELSTPLPS